MHRVRIALVAVVSLVALVAAVPGRAAEPAGGTLSDQNPVVHWRGGPFAALNPVVTTDCVAPQAPFCDTYDLTLGPLPEGLPDVTVTAAADNAGDFISLAVYDQRGQKVAATPGLSWKQEVVIRAAQSGATYSVRVELVFGTPTASAYSGTAMASNAAEVVDLSQECTVEKTALVAEPDDGRRVDLDVLVLLDGVDQAFAEKFFADVARPYAELNVRVVPVYQVADPPFVGDSSVDLLNQARARFPGGRVPAQYDIVEVLTNKDIQLLGQTAVAGQADCLGGLAYDERSYEVSEAGVPGLSDDGIPLGPLTFDAKLAAKTTAHEMGHLLGGQHHYANCAEGNDPDEELHGDTSPCTLMFNSADFISLHFGTVNGKIARAYALAYASQNDPAA